MSGKKGNRGKIVAGFLIIVIVIVIISIIAYLAVISETCKKQTFDDCVERIESLGWDRESTDLVIHQNCLYVYQTTIIDLSCYS